MTPKERDEIKNVIWCLSHYPSVLRGVARDCFFEGDEGFDELETIAELIETQIADLYRITALKE